jgi:ATP-binding cassette subfamily B protein
MADLMVRMIDPDGGRVSIDGHDLRDLALGDLRRAMLLVEQTPFLFNATLSAISPLVLTIRATMRLCRHDAGLEGLLARLPRFERLWGARSGHAGERQR